MRLNPESVRQQFPAQAQIVKDKPVVFSMGQVVHKRHNRCWMPWWLI